jgi:hypothetical protein
MSFISAFLAIFNWYNDQIKEDEMSRACSTHREKMNAYMILMGEPEGKRALGRFRCTEEDNIKMDLQ